MLESLRLIHRDEDALRDRRPVYRIAEPVIRLHQLVVAPNEAVLALRLAERVWAAQADTVSSRIYGPHFEDLARDWCLAYAGPEAIGGLPSVVRPATLACRTHKQGHELDVVAVQVIPGEANRVLAIGEAKAATRPVEVAELARLDHLRALLPPGGTAPPRLLIFGRAGFSPALRRAADARTDVSLIDLDRMYHAG